MGFDSLLGNTRIKENLRQALAQGRISHFYLISGPAGSGRHTLARLLAAGILCRENNRPCMTCPACRKVLGDTHPDFITVDDPEKKTVPVDLIRQARADIYIQPNEASHKIYLFPRAQDMGIPGQNALLKVLEEPPSYGVFILLTDNPEKLLSTVRSRCTLLTLTALPETVLKGELVKAFPNASSDAIDAAITRSAGFLGQAKKLLQEGDALPPQTQDFVRAYAARDSLSLIQVLVPMEKWKRDQLLPVLNQWASILQDALVSRAGMGAPTAAVTAISAARSSQELTGAIANLRKAIEYTQGNVSPAAVCGWLEWALR